MLIPSIILFDLLKDNWIFLDVFYNEIILVSFKSLTFCFGFGFLSKQGGLELFAGVVSCEFSSVIFLLCNLHT